MLRNLRRNSSVNIVNGVNIGNSKQMMAVDINGKMEDVYVYSRNGKYTGYERRDTIRQIDYAPRFIEQGRVGKTPKEVFEMRRNKL